jgi:hypothetical protein
MRHTKRANEMVLNVELCALIDPSVIWTGHCLETA